MLTKQGIWTLLCFNLMACSLSVQPEPPPRESLLTADASVNQAKVLNQGSLLVCVTQITGQISQKLDVDNQCTDIPRPDTLPFESELAQKLAALGYNYLYLSRCTTALPLFQEALTLETGVVARQYLAAQISHMQRCSD